MIEDSVTTEREIIWLTGASSGIGRALAKQLAEAGYRVIASARSTESLQALADDCEGIEPLVCDVTDEQSLASAKAQLIQRFGYIDRAIINAGTCEYLDFPEPDWSSLERVMKVNYFGATASVQVALELIRQRPAERIATLGQGHIMAVVSQVVFAPFTRAEAYGASKAALSYFIDSLRLDIADEGIDVTAIYPGFVDTPLTQKNDFDMPFLLSAEEAGARIVKHALARPARYVFPKRLRAMLALSVLMPKTWARIVSQ